MPDSNECIGEYSFVFADNPDHAVDKAKAFCPYWTGLGGVGFKCRPLPARDCSHTVLSDHLLGRRIFVDIPEGNTREANKSLYIRWADGCS